MLDTGVVEGMELGLNKSAMLKRGGLSNDEGVCGHPGLLDSIELVFGAVQGSISIRSRDKPLEASLFSK